MCVFAEVGWTNIHDINSISYDRRNSIIVRHWNLAYRLSNVTSTSAKSLYCLSLSLYYVISHTLQSYYSGTEYTASHVTRKRSNNGIWNVLLTNRCATIKYVIWQQSHCCDFISYYLKYDVFNCLEAVYCAWMVKCTWLR